MCDLLNGGTIYGICESDGLDQTARMLKCHHMTDIKKHWLSRDTDLNDVTYVYISRCWLQRYRLSDGSGLK